MEILKMSNSLHFDRIESLVDDNQPTNEPTIESTIEPTIEPLNEPVKITNESGDSNDIIIDINDDATIITALEQNQNQNFATKTMSKKKIIKANVNTLNRLSLSRNFDKECSDKDIVIKVFDDIRPKDKIYFEQSENYDGIAKGMATVIPFFNEENHAVQQTLNSLYNGWNYLRAGSKKWRGCNLYVCLIQDGWYKSHDSMKEYLKALFPKKIDDGTTQKYWWELSDFNLTIEQQKDCVDRTYIIERKKYCVTKINPQEKFTNDKKYMIITLIIKINNRRKHNSHEWFFGKNGFADSINAEYLFFTDAFTLYNNWCIFHLCKALDKNPKLIATTGRQRLMSKIQQGSTESILSIETILRMVQTYDFESSNVIYNGAFSLGGMLPVIPGPCGMYRGSNLRNDKIRNYYFSTVNEEPDKTGMVLGNLRIAEDRILTYAAVIKSDIDGAYMEFNPLSIFYFEAETDLDTLIFQRRRWINGSVAGYLYLLFFNFKHFGQWKTNVFKKVYIWLLLMTQFLTYMMVGIAPSVTLRILYFGINYFIDYYGLTPSFNMIIIGILFWVIYIIHILIHHTRSKFNYMIMYLLFVMSIITSALSIATLIHYAFIFQKMNFLDIILSKNVILYLALYVFFGPFVVSLLLSGKGHSFLFMTKSFIAYYLFLPMLIAWFGSYSYARLWDLSWGNRPASEMDSVSVSKKEKIVKKFKIANRKIIFVLVIVNIVLFMIPFEGQLIIMSIFFALAAYQLSLSIIYCLLKLFYKITFMFKRLTLCCNKMKQ
jgi:cellulose synthase/poly-beta-1,6-N-acetylglucosamine synthase-like glycosyltransferase